MEEIPDSLIINWDQTGINYVPVSQWTMAKQGWKHVEVVIKGKSQQYLQGIWQETFCLSN